MTNSKNKNLAYIVCLLFFIIFSPPILPAINIVIPISVFCGVLLFIKFRNDTKSILNYSSMKVFFLLFAVFMTYLLTIMAINAMSGERVDISNYAIEIYRFSLLLLVTGTCILYLICMLKKINCKPDKLLFLLVVAGLFQSILCLLSLAFPSVKQFFVQIMLYNTNSKVIATKPWEVKQRFFGFANDMLDIFGYGIGILAALPFYLCAYKKKWEYLLFVPFLFITVFFNSRSGLIIFAIGLICSLPALFQSQNKKQKILLLSSLLGLIAMLIGGLFIFNIYFPKTVEWVTRDITSIFKFLFTGYKGEMSTNTASVLFSERFWKFPDFPKIISGTGHTVFAIKGFANSDVGYVNDLWLCGIIGCLLLYGLFIYLFFKMWKLSPDRVGKCLAIFLFLSFLVFQIKASGIRFNPGMFCSLLLCFYYIYYYNCQKINDIIKASNNYDYTDNLESLGVQPIISVIVPIYKVKKYLSKCIDSIIAQDYKNLEIILVDDGSPDNCPEICDEYAKKDKRIRVVHKENGGLSDARNAGIKVATGEYIAFIDSDDYVAKNYISMLLYTLKKYDADISACNYIKVYEDTGRQEVEPKTDKELVMTNVEAMKDLFTLPSNSDVVTWNKLYRTSLFIDNNIEFPKGKLHEDNFTTYKLYYYSSRVAFVNVPCYYYLQRKDSIMGQKFNPRRLDILLALKEIKKFVKKNNIDLEQEIKFNELLILLGLLNSMIDTNCIDDKVFEDISNRIIKDKREYLNNPYLRTKNKLAIYSLQAGKGTYTLVRKLFVLKNKLK